MKTHCKTLLRCPNCFILRKKHLALSLAALFILCLVWNSHTSLYPGYSSKTSYQSNHLNSKRIIAERQSELNHILFQHLHNLTNNRSFHPELKSNWFQFESHIFLYSAFVDDVSVPPYTGKPGLYIKVLAAVLPMLPIVEAYLPFPISCLLKYLNETKTAAASLRVFEKEHHYKMYRGAFFYCPVPSKDLPVSVALISKASRNPHWLELKEAFSQPKSEPKYNLSICVRPFFGPYNSLIQLSEFIGYYESVGANHFEFYNYSTSKEVLDFLLLLASRTNLSFSVQPWSLEKVGLDSEVFHAEGQMICIQDCILRSRSHSRFVLLVDLDEFVMPQKTLNVVNLLSQLALTNPDSGSFLFSSILFCEENMPQDSNNMTLLVTQLALQRQKTPWVHTVRSKYALIPGRVDVGGIHEVWHHKDPYFNLNVEPSTAMIYHYRTCINMSQPYFLQLLEFSTLEQDEMITDKRMLLLREQLENSSSIKFIQGLLKSPKRR